MYSQPTSGYVTCLALFKFSDFVPSILQHLDPKLSFYSLSLDFRDLHPLLTVYPRVHDSAICTDVMTAPLTLESK